MASGGRYGSVGTDGMVVRGVQGWPGLGRGEENAEDGREVRREWNRRSAVRFNREGQRDCGGRGSCPKWWSREGWWRQTMKGKEGRVVLATLAAAQGRRRWRYGGGRGWGSRSHIFAGSRKGEAAASAASTAAARGCAAAVVAAEAAVGLLP